jgi:hypothetical protein
MDVVCQATVLMSTKLLYPGNPYFHTGSGTVSDNHDQFRFNDDGELEEPDENEEDEVQTNDFSEEMPWYETKSGFRRDVVSSLFQKAVRRSDEEVAAWSAFELVRSGAKYETHYWNRAALVTLEDLKAGNEAIEHVLRYRDLADSEFSDNEWARRLCAIAAALVASRAESSRESVHANGFFDCVAKDRVRSVEEDDYEPLYEDPVTEEDLSEGGKYDVALDRHTYVGSALGRSGDTGWRHFRLHGARCSGTTEVGKKWWERILEYERLGHRDHQMEFTEDEIEHAVKPTAQDDPWRCEFDEDTDLDEFDSED